MCILAVLRPVDIMTIPGGAEALLEELEGAGIPCTTYIEDLEPLLELERAERKGARAEFSLTEYHDYPEVGGDWGEWVETYRVKWK